ncbi:MAG: hypothetical protein ACUVRA_04655 [Candidatus Bathyarchaeaceae archaeon]
MRRKTDILLLLLLLHLYKKPIIGRTRFQKIVCVLKEKFGVPFECKFRSYYYGPYSEELADSLSLLQGTKLVNETTEVLGINVVRYNYELTEKGKEIAEKIISEIGDKKFLEEFKKNLSEIQKIPTPELISLSKKLCGID